MIPDDWAVRSIGQTFRLVNGCAFKPEDWKRSGTPIVRIQNLNDPSAPFNFSQAPVAERNRVEPGDLLFAWSGTIGSSFGARVWAGPSGVLNQHIFKVAIDERQITLPFSLVVFARVEADIAKQAHGFKASFVHVKKSDLVKVHLPLPPLPEQGAIAEALSDVDSLLDGLDRLIAKKRDLKQAAMQQLLTGQTRLPGFHSDWTVRLLGELAAVSKGTQLRSSELDDAGQFAHLNGGTTPSGYTTKWNSKGHTIAISEGGNSCGHVQFMEQPYWCGGHCYSVIPNSIDNRFLYQALKAQQPAIMALRVGSGLPNVQKTALTAFKVKLSISADEQTAIASVLSDMDAELTALEARRDKTRALKQGMMQELLTGRTRLV
ncbi:restriction endonuclease subunit S [Methylibium sp.]|uniref:restriction endonuclease subunit S n=1 Tax=Methylibium sp. TaxID=2067992 RepID=UPI003D0A9D77